MKGCTSPNTYECSLKLIAQLTPHLDNTVIDPTGVNAFPYNVMALLPYMLEHYEDANDVCIKSADNIAQVRFNNNLT